MTDRAPAPAGYVLGHTARDPRSRAAKAAKIIAVLGKRRALANARVLEVGTGAGVIAQALRPKRPPCTASTSSTTGSSPPATPRSW